MLAAAGLLAIAFTACSGSKSVQVSTSAFPPVSTTAPSEPGERFQGSVTTVDADRSQFGMAVHIVWTPVLEARQEDRKVSVGPGTAWKPAGEGLGELRAGEDVQVDAVLGPDGTWQARQIQLFDLE